MPATPPVPTKRSIFNRIKQGPVQFDTLAVYKNAKTRHRIAARLFCAQLVAEEKIIRVYIGRYPYYIENTEEAKLKAIRQVIEENSKFNPVTGCTNWISYCDGIRGPVIRQALIGKNGTHSVRRWLYEQKTGRKLKYNGDYVKMQQTCDENCVDTEHMIRVTRSKILKGTKKSLSAKLAMQKAMLKRWGRRTDAAEIIRKSPKTNRELAEELGMSPSNIWSIRTGRTHKLQRSPFSGLEVLA